MLTNKISEHISYVEATKSRTAIIKGIDNTPDNTTLERMKILAEAVFEPLREHIGVPIAITSFYRSSKLNKEVGGSSTSEHVWGSAMDLDADVLGLTTNKDIFDYIREKLQFNQLIWEFGTDKNPDWVHVSFKKEGNKNQVLKATYGRNAFGKSVKRYNQYK